MRFRICQADFEELTIVDVAYKALNDSFIIFVCLFDPIGSNRAVYTFENICVEDKRIPLRDGTKKMIQTVKRNEQLRMYAVEINKGVRHVAGYGG